MKLTFLTSVLIVAWVAIAALPVRATPLEYRLASVRFVNVDADTAENLEKILPFAAASQVTPGQIDYALKLLALLPGIRDVTAEYDVAAQRLNISVQRQAVLTTARLTFRERIRYGRDDYGDMLDYVQTPVAYSAELTEQAARDFANRLISLGYLDAEVKPFVHWQNAYAAALELRVDAGRLYRVSSLTWDGPDLPLDKSKLEKFAISGRPWDRNLLQTEFSKKIVELRKQGYWDARGDLTCQPSANWHVECRALLIAGSKVGFRYVGNRTYYSPDLQAVLDLNPEQRYSIADLIALKDRLAEFYRERGFYFAEVTTMTNTSADASEVEIVFFVHENQRLSFGGLRILGLEAELATELQKRLQISPTLRDAIFRGKDRQLTNKLRRSELERIDLELQRLGFLQGAVQSEQTLVEKDKLIWQIHIHAGQRYYWGDVVLPTSVGQEEIFIDPGLRSGQPVNFDLVRSHAERWLTHMREEGYLDAAAKMSVRTLDRQAVVHVRLDTFTGPRYAVAYVLVDGAERTRESAIRGVLPLRQGDIANDARLNDGRRILLERRVFRQVNSRWLLRDAALGYAVAGYQVLERDGGEFEIGFLLTTGEGVGLDMRLGHNRLFGSFRSLHLAGSVLYPADAFFNGDLVVSEPYLTRWGLRYREPIPARMPLFGDVLGAIELNRSDRDIEWLAQTIAFGPALQPTRLLTLSLNYLYEWFETLRIKQPAYQIYGVAVADQIDRLGGLRASTLYERFDNRFDPKVGWGLFQEAQFFHPSLGGEHRLLRYEGNIRYIQDLFANVSLWLGARGGSIAAQSPDVSRIRSKVFRLGGSGSVRGYARDSVSPYVDRDNLGQPVFDRNNRAVAVPIGGKWFVNLQTELRIALTDSLELAAFEDSAYVGAFSNANLAADGVAAAGYGAGLLYHTPAGPLRLDVGRKIIAIPTDRDTFAVHFYVSTTF